jgi:hypothetical protein
MGNALLQTYDSREILHTWDQDQPEVVSVFHKYSTYMSRYEKEHPDKYRSMVESRSTDTDGHVVRMLESMGLHSDKKPPTRYEAYGMFVSDVLLLTRAVWTTAMGHPDMKMKVDDPKLLDANNVITQLQYIQNDKLLRSIYQMKCSYTDLTQPAQTNEDDSIQYCSVLTCWTTVDRNHPFTMNSMTYCDYHKGTALFNGLRHSSDVCGPCKFWNVLALKTTCYDSGHNHYHVSVLSPGCIGSSVSTSTSTRMENVDIRWHKSKGTPRYVTNWGMHGNFYPMEEKYKEITPRYYSAKHKKICRVPDGSMVTYPLNDNGLVDAWIHAEGHNLLTNCKRRITDLDQIHDILEKYRVGGNPMWRLTTKSKETPEDRQWLF